jgi:glycosyltransferase involved in cell wall biosynthesis
MNPNLTVIIPVYNGMPFLPETVESILQQTYEDFRLLIIDDGSKDESLNYLKLLGNSRVKVIHQNNMGLCETLNQAIKNVETEFVARLDQDDIALPQRLQEQMDFLMTHRDYDFVLSNISKISTNGKSFGHYEKNYSELISDYDWGQYGCLAHSTICFRKEAFLKLGGYRQSLYPVDDYDLLLRADENFKIAVINKPLVKYRIHSKAGTFKTFNDMQIKSRYVEVIAGMRRSGEPEISMDDYVKTCDRMSLFDKFRTYTHTKGKLLFRQSGALIGEQKYLPGI